MAKAKAKKTKEESKPAAIVSYGRDGIKPDTFYGLKNGKPVEVQGAA